MRKNYKVKNTNKTKLKTYLKNKQTNEINRGHATSRSSK